MKVTRLALAATVAATPLAAQEQRQLDAHVHGVSSLELAIEGGTVEMDFYAPGMDIVGFEYAASSDADKDKVEAAIRLMLVPENVVALPEEAGCRLTEVLAHLHSGEDHDEHNNDDGHAHDEHAEDKDHDHGDDHAEHAEDAEHAEHSEDADHDHAGESGHSEFHARYIFACEHADDLDTITFPFFDQFENAEEIEVQYVTETGAGSAEVGRGAAEVTLD
ncbi:DUF2796 domain-containing protein [Sulfitobacter sp. D35]|uniref:zinc uptake protein ZrgA n=1 Tax=Sulfitobacter sp. D35 TaxID=3083252 RepID=UPI0029700131|nr:DUF2796 domain-containing protein [Sulfitobacter sp. D35]MDW4498854.1 DUF2796 domain-containing protein [Sulfitobacter sp. D35]